MVLKIKYNLPTPSVGGLSIYLAQIKKFPMLDAEEEYMLQKIGVKMVIYNLHINLLLVI